MKFAKVVFVATVFCTAAWSQADGRQFGYELAKNQFGKLILSVKVQSAEKGLFLGLSLYPPNVKNQMDEGAHYSFPVKQGLYVKDMEIEPRFENGTFESALWTGKLSRNQCAADDAICQKLGFKHTGMAGYLWGLLRTR